MSVVGEIGLAIGVVAVVAQVVSAYRDGGSIVDRIKQKRAERRERPIPRQLEDTVKDTPQDIEREQNRGISKFGDAFRQGDYIAILTIQQITIQVQTSFLAKLRTAYDEDMDFGALTNDADIGRDGTIRALMDLQQRLMTAAPLSSLPTLTQTPVPAYAQARGAPFGAAQLLPTTPTAIPTQNFLENSTRPHSLTETVDPAGRQNGHHWFHRPKKQLRTRNASQDHTPEVDQDGFRRVYTIPTNSSGAISSSPLEQTPPIPPLKASPPQNRNFVVQNTTASPRPNLYSYESWEDDPAAIWGSPRSPRASTHFANITTDLLPPSRTSTSRSVSSSNSIPHPEPSNNYLGFCKGAWKLQNGDRKSMVKSADYTQSAQSKLKFLRCSKCEFEGHFNPDIIWNKIFKFDTMKIRWSFLAKSHVHQRSPQDRQLAKRCEFTYQCIFCVFLGQQTPAMHGAKAYHDHIYMWHYGAELTDLVLWKAHCVNDRVCDDSEDFDINLYPKITELSG